MAAAQEGRHAARLKFKSSWQILIPLCAVFFSAAVAVLRSPVLGDLTFTLMMTAVSLGMAFFGLSEVESRHVV